jgi:hypothetical protein
MSAFCSGCDNGADVQYGEVFSPWFFLIFPLAAITKFVQYTFLPPKYFYDSRGILRIMTSAPSFLFAPDGYNNAAVFSNAINVFELTTLQQWSVFYAVIFNIVLFNIARKYAIRTFSAWLWFFGACGVLNLYVFNLSKDIFQFTVFLIVYLALRGGKSLSSKIVMSVGVLFFWGLIFRIYYCLIAAYVAMTYILLQYFPKIKRLLPMAGLIFAVFLVSFILIRFITPENYEEMSTVRRWVYGQLDNPDTETVMLDAIENDGSPLILCTNAFLLAVRLMLPVELLFVGLRIRYFLFIGYQFIIAACYLKTAAAVLRQQAGGTQTAAFCVFTGFLLGSGLFEFDVGSWVRHESAIILIMCAMFFKRRCRGGRKQFFNIVN